MLIDPFKRKQDWKFRGLGPTGRKLCFCGCGQEVGPKRSSSAGPACVKAWAAHSDLNGIKRRVEDRDKGVCAICGVDTASLKSKWSRELYDFYKSKFGVREGFEHQGIYLLWMVRSVDGCPKPPSGFPCNDRRWWEADHIVPVVEGGGGCDFNGYRTLCIPCHRAETAALRKRMSAACLTPCCRKKPIVLSQSGEQLDVRCECLLTHSYNQRTRRYFVPVRP